jgi:hypothetical protein
MNKEAHDAVRKVLKEAGEHEHFFDFSDAERLTWMIERAYKLGRATTALRTVVHTPGQKSSRCSRKRQTSR